MTLATLQATVSDTLPLFNVALDAGNYAVKFLNDSASHPVSMRSVVADIPHGVNPKRHSVESPIVVYGSERFHFGTQAYKYSTGFTPIVVTDKTAIGNYRRAMLAVLGAVNGCCEYQVHLRISLPAPDPSLAEALKGQYRYFHNGFQMSVEVLSVDTEYEGVAGWLYADTLGLVPDKGYTLVVDIGSGTANVLVLDSEGEIVGEPQSYDKGGTVSLATALSQNSLLYERLGDVPNLAYVIDGLADGTNEYCDTGIGWGGWMQPYVDRWLTSILSYAKTTYAAYLPRVRCFLFVGGNVHLLKTRLDSKPGVVLCPDPELANVRGLMQ
jgi:hypothetical protein